MIETILNIFKEYSKDILIGVLSSISASYMFLYYTDKLRISKLKISEQAVEKIFGEKRYLIFKIINLSKRPIYDVKMTWIISEKFQYKTENGNSIGVKNRNVSDSVFSPDVLNGYNKKDEIAHYAYQFRMPYNQPLAENESIILRISFLDAYSGTKRYLSQSYTKNEIKKGDFAFGKSSKIL
jgi:hypothetical protein